MTQLRTRPKTRVEPVAPQRTGRWILWVAGLALLASVAALVFVVLSAPTARDTPFLEDFTGVDEFVYERVHSTVVETPFQEDFGGLD